MNAGHVRVFDLVGSTWVQVGGDIYGEAAGDFSGSAVSLSADGSVVAIGAANNDSGGLNAGHVRVFGLEGSTWVQVGGDIYGEAPLDFSGSAVSLSADGTVLAVGASGNDGAGDNAGHVRVFDLAGSSWVQVGEDIDGEAAGDSSGAVSLASDGGRVAIGASGNDGTGDNAGHVRVFDLVESAWVQVGQDIDGEAAGDGSGGVMSLSADGTHVAIGATKNTAGLGSTAGLFAGHVRVFGLAGSSWVQVGEDIDGTASRDDVGIAVSLSANGTRVAVSSRTGFGQVRLFDLIGASWVQAGEAIQGEAARDFHNRATSLSADGSRVAIGSPTNDGAGFNAGHVRVFDSVVGAVCDYKVVTVDMNLGASGVGTAGDDVILGTTGDDVIDAGDGNDTVCAGDGDDLVVAGDGDDVVFGEAGNDIIRGNAGADSLTGGDGNDRLFGGIDGDTLLGGPGNDFLGGFGGADLIVGDHGNDIIFGGFGADVIHGDDGDDDIHGLIGNDVINGGLGNDRLHGDRGNDTINGGPGDDIITGGNANDRLNGDEGDDDISGGKGNDQMSGGGTDICAGNKEVHFDLAAGDCEAIFGVP